MPVPIGGLAGEVGDELQSPPGQGVARERKLSPTPSLTVELT